MGILRFLLAVSVLLSHSESIFGFALIDSFVAVQCFFMISGFYMALILSGKYHTNTAKGYLLFLTNRLMRIYPVYWAVLLLTVLFLAAGYYKLNYSPLFDRYIYMLEQGNVFSVLFLIASNVLIIGQDLIMFLAYDTISRDVYFTSDFSSEPYPLARFLAIPQAWSLSIEIVFYVLCPLLIRFKSIYLWIFVFIMLVFRIMAYSSGLYHDPWSYRFFPFELMYFLLGMLAYRMYRGVKLKSIWPLIVVLILTGIYTLNGSKFYYVFYEVIFFIALPYIFNFFKEVKWDAFVGEFSYPIYIVHILIRRIIDVVAKYFSIDTNLQGLLTLVLSILVSYILIITVIRPVDRWRAVRIKKAG